MDEPQEMIMRQDDNAIFLKGILGNRMGTITLTDARLVFMEQKYYALGAMEGLAQIIANEAGWLKKCKMNVMLDEIESYHNGEKKSNRNVLFLTTKTGENYKVRLGSEWEEWEPLLKKYIGN